MIPFLTEFTAQGPAIVAGVVAFAAFFLIARVVRANEKIALAFGLMPLLLFWVIGAAAVSAASSGLI